MSDFQFRIPHLLVSVRSEREAAAALAGGCDVLDVKEPSRGPLGMAEVATITAIVDQAGARKAPVPVSVALGEALEWKLERPAPRLPAGIAYLKLGTALLPVDAAASQFVAVRRCIESAIAVPRAGVFAPSPRWIAVAYADFELARSPPPEQIAELASDCGCAGLLVDTFSKERKRLVDWLDERRLAALAVLCRKQGLSFALAGRLRAGDLPQVLAVHPDLIGIRSAACRDGYRNGPIHIDSVRAFRSSLRAEFDELCRAESDPQGLPVRTA